MASDSLRTGRYVYVALGEENAIGVIDTRTLEVVKKVSGGL